MKCTGKEWDTCRVEKMGCAHCFYEKERWEYIRGYDNNYQISSYGRVKSLKFSKEKYLKPKQNRGGYLEVLLYKNNKGKLYRIHRLVAEAFIQNTYNYPEVNHKDGDKLNNCVSNLEWCTRSKNQKHACVTSLAGSISKVKDRARINGKQACKRIIQETVDGEVIRVWDSQTSAAIELNLTRTSISNCLNNRTKTAGGYSWKYIVNTMKGDVKWEEN